MARAVRRRVSRPEGPAEVIRETSDTQQPAVAAPFAARYKIIRGADMFDLATAVNHAIIAGWTPLGGVVYVPMDPMQFARVASQGEQPLPYWQTMLRD